MMKLLKTSAAAAGLAALGLTAKLGADFYNNEYQLLKSVKKLDDNIMLLDYTLDYDLDGFLAKGVSNTGELLVGISKKHLHGLKALKSGDADFACSSFNAKTPEGEYIFGRNFDYKKAPCMVVWTHPENGYASVNVADCNFMVYGYKKTAQNPLDRFQLLFAPYCCMDGINEKGLSIGILEIKTKATYQNTGKKPICTTALLRGVLDKCATVDEAIDFFKSFDIHDSIFCCYHYQITDATGASVIIEYVNNEMRLLYPTKGYKHEFQCLTNFFLSADGDNKKGFGYDRFDTMQSTLIKKDGILSEREGMKLLDEVQMNYQHERYPWEVITLWSALYNNTKQTMQLCAGLDYFHRYSFGIAPNTLL